MLLELSSPLVYSEEIKETIIQCCGVVCILINLIDHSMGCCSESDNYYSDCKLSQSPCYFQLNVICR